MMQRRWTYALCLILLSSNAFSQISKEQKVHGSFQTGIWYLKNNVSSFDQDGIQYTAQDQYGNSYVQDDYMLYHARLKLDTGREDDPVRFHFKGRFLYNIKDSNYTLGINERYRYQMDELNTELNKFKNTKLYLGRRTNFEAGGIGVDGITAVIDASDVIDVGLYAGLGVDPRQFTGYIGPNYRQNPVNLDYFASGAFTSYRKDRFQLDLALNSLLHEFSMDRMNAFAHWMGVLNDTWSISGLLDVGVAGDPGLVQAQGILHTKITSTITNQFSYHRYRSIFFNASDASGVPVPSDINPNFDLGDQVDTSYYQSFHNHTKFKLQRNYFFTRVGYAMREFDDLTRKEFSIGYRDPNIAKSNVDVTIKTTLIDNYRSYHAIFDLMLGMDIIAQKLKFETGGNVSFNERDVFENFQLVEGQIQAEQESTLRANLIYQPTLKMGWYLQYRLYNQVDAVNLDQKVQLHEVFLSSNLRF